MEGHSRDLIETSSQEEGGKAAARVVSL